MIAACCPPCADLASHDRMATIRADYQRGGFDRRHAAASITDDHSRHPSAMVPVQADDRSTEPDVRAGSFGGVDQQRVEHGAARRIQRVDAGRRLDRHRN